MTEVSLDLDRAIRAQRHHDIVAAIVRDQGKADRQSEVRLQLIHRFAALAVLAEQMERRLARGGEINIAAHALLSSTLVRLAQVIGIDRATPDRNLTLADLMRSPEVEEKK